MSARKKPGRRVARPRLRVVSRPAPPPKPAFEQTADATTRQLTLFQLVRARAAFMAAIQGMTSATANRPMGEGKWCVREVVLHVMARDQARLQEMEAALHGTRASWIGSSDEDWARINAEELAPLRHHAWEETLRLLQSTRQQLIVALEAIPEEPVEVWSKEHPFGEMLAGLAPHDRHHADAIKRWREESMPTVG